MTCSDMDFANEPETEYELFTRRAAKLDADVAAARTSAEVKQALRKFMESIPAVRDAPPIVFWELRPMLCSGH